MCLDAYLFSRDVILAGAMDNPIKSTGSTVQPISGCMLMKLILAKNQTGNNNIKTTKNLFAFLCQKQGQGFTVRMDWFIPCYCCLILRCPLGYWSVYTSSINLQKKKKKERSNQNLA